MDQAVIGPFSTCVARSMNRMKPRYFVILGVVLASCGQGQESVSCDTGGRFHLEVMDSETRDALLDDLRQAELVFSIGDEGILCFSAEDEDIVLATFVDAHQQRFGGVNELNFPDDAITAEVLRRLDAEDVAFERVESPIERQIRIRVLPTTDRERITQVTREVIEEMVGPITE